MEVGEGVENVAVGDRVAIEAVSQGRACKTCRFCQAGQFRRCVKSGTPAEWAREGWGGGFAEYIKRRGVACYKLPSHVTWEEGALVEPPAVGVHGVRRARMLGGETVGGHDFGTVKQAFEIGRGLGRIVILGIFHDEAEIDFFMPFRKEQSIIFAQCYSFIDEIHDFTIARDIVASRRLPLSEMVTHTFPLEKADEAVKTAMDKTTGSIKVQLVP